MMFAGLEEQYLNIGFSLFKMGPPRSFFLVGFIFPWTWSIGALYVFSSIKFSFFFLLLYFIFICMLFVGWLFYFDIVRHKTTQSYGVWQSVDAHGMSLYYCRLLLLPLLSSFLSRSHSLLALVGQQLTSYQAFMILLFCTLFYMLDDSIVCSPFFFV